MCIKQYKSPYSFESINFSNGTKETISQARILNGLAAICISFVFKLGMNFAAMVITISTKYKPSNSKRISKRNFNINAVFFFNEKKR